jgi:16S rRNA processing protein RimM
MIDFDACMPIGECVKQHGVKGELVIRLNTGIDLESITGDFLLFELDGGLVPFKIQHMRSKNADDILVILENADSESRIRQLLNASVYIESHLIDADPDWQDNYSMLIGWQAHDINAGELGIVLDIMDISKNPLFVIDYQSEEILIPINEDFISELDETNRTIHFNLPEGLINMNL